MKARYPEHIVRVANDSLNGLTIERLDITTGKPYTMRLERGAAIQLLELLQEYKAQWDRMTPAVIRYNSMEGWSWTSQEADFSSRFFTTGEKARKDLESKGFYVDGED